MRLREEYRPTLRRLLLALILASTIWVPTRSAHLASPHLASPPFVLESPIQPCGPLTFPLGSAKLSDEDKKCLLEIAMVLGYYPEVKLVIDGHRHWTEDVNLSRVRAINARDYIIYEKGVDAARMIARDLDDSCPDETGDTGFNPRVQFWYLQEVRLSNPLASGRGAFPARSLSPELSNSQMSPLRNERIREPDR